MKKNIITIFIACLILSGCKDVGVKVESDQKESGRFQVFVSDVGVFLVDTVKGDTWKYTRITTKDDEIWEEVWQSIERQNGSEYLHSMELLEQYEAQKQTKPN